MKNALPFLLLSLSACTATKSTLDSSNQAIKSHAQPVKIFGIGSYSSKSIVLTLVDAENKYFTVEVPKIPSLKVGDVYPGF
ncbi:hypothetical protein [Mucilaginibacter paludis]|uniref:Lipoprotein n=1 Tax=Mucilaginibacter paludis DSM 18603 TaxID=714943 RepID=H1Y7I2_9SPHI|nr:hypothetical protein [Mucilaginibacter paludis]EHQ29403.1 hypothetical protein Mucpa_5329 [Mucilaginibacter paludis DSM 18603]